MRRVAISNKKEGDIVPLFEWIDGIVCVVVELRLPN